MMSPPYSAGTSAETRRYNSIANSICVSGTRLASSSARDQSGGDNAPHSTGGSKMKQAAFYARVSTGKQEERGTIASQVAVLRERIVQDRCHLDPEHEFIDDGISGVNLARPALDRFRDEASTRVIEGLCWALLCKYFRHRCRFKNATVVA